MNKFSIVLLFSLVVVSAYAVPATKEVGKSEKKVDQRTTSLEEGVVANVVTPKARAQCWICGYPCGAYYCCHDGYPNCCLVNGRCTCCRG